MDKPDRYRTLAPYYDIFIDWENRLALEIPFILKTLGGPAAAVRALDLGCGTGRHLRALAETGMRIEGSEPSPELRELARGALPGAPLYSAALEDLRELAGAHGPWGLVICLGNTLAHLPADKLTAFFSGLVSALEQPGTAVIHLLGYEKILSTRPAGLLSKTVVRGEKTYRFERHYIYFETHLEFIITVWENEVRLAADREILYPLTASTLLESAAEAGIGELDLYAGFDFSKPYGPGSDNLVAVIRKN